MGKYEFKYFVPQTRIDALRRSLMPFVDLDEYAQRIGGEYTVSSIYYDTLSFDAYHEKLAGIKHRQKLRIRGYGTSDTEQHVYLEIKRKNDMLISKSRAAVPYEHVDEFLRTATLDSAASNGNGSNRANAEAFLYHVRRRGMRPVVLVRYQRQAFLSRTGPPVRITFDRNVSAAASPDLSDLYADVPMYEEFRNVVIFEAKFPLHMPPWLEATIDRFDLKRTAISKYTHGLEACGAVRVGEVGTASGIPQPSDGGGYVWRI